jgi:hypothetical protein
MNAPEQLIAVEGIDKKLGMRLRVSYRRYYFFLRVVRQASAPITTMTMMTAKMTRASFVVDDTVIGSVTEPGTAPNAAPPLMYWLTRAGVIGFAASVSLTVRPVKFARYMMLPKAGGPGTDTEYFVLLSAIAAATGVHVLPSVLC